MKKKQARLSPRKIVVDYYMLSKMTKELFNVQSHFIKFSKGMANLAKRSDLGEGTLDDLKDIELHLAAAYKELEKAKRKLKTI